MIVRETSFGKLAPEDKKGHEPFSSDREMYETYSRYYKISVTPQTPIKVIRFRLVKRNEKEANPIGSFR